VLVGEVVAEGARGPAGGPGHVAHGHALETMGGDRAGRDRGELRPTHLGIDDFRHAVTVSHNSCDKKGGMDDRYIEQINARAVYEAGRTEPPDGFPKFPGLPLGRYTDPAFFE